MRLFSFTERHLALCLAVLAAVVLAGRAPQGHAQGAAPPPIVLGSPVDCQVPEVCWVQNYFDHNPGPGAEDHTCGPRTYDRHYGIDIRVANLNVMARGIPVVAAADGVVGGVRDGIEDSGIVEADPASVRGVECGNGVVLTHPGGWTTQYCHMMKGSIAVEKGQRVAAGTRLGDIGLSGLTQFPHLHFEVRNGGTRIDPFVGPEATGQCGSVGQPLFDRAFLEANAYVETGLLNAGFTDRPPSGLEVLRGEHQNAALPADAPALIYWVELFGTQPGDRDRLTLYAPDGSVVVQQTREPMEGHSARHLAYAGRRTPPGGWPPGTYRGVFELLRGVADATRVAFMLERTVQVGDAPAARPVAAAATPPAATPPPPPRLPAAAPDGAAAQAPAPAPAPSAQPSRGETPPAPAASAAEPPTASGTAQAADSMPAEPPPQEAGGTTGLPFDVSLPFAIDLPFSLRGAADARGPAPWLVAAGLIGVIVFMAGIAFVTRH